MLYTTKLKPILSNPAKIFSFPLAISKQICYNNTVICRGIEAVITGLTRNFVVTLEPPTLNPLIYKGFPQFK